MGHDISASVPEGTKMHQKSLKFVLSKNQVKYKSLISVIML